MKVLALSGSNNSASINLELIKYVVPLLDLPCDIIDLRDYHIPMYSEDEERRNGFSSDLLSLDTAFKSYDGYVISIPEHNGNFPAFFKNIIDWFTRIETKFFRGKPVLLLNASPGLEGGKSVLKITVNSFPFFGGNVTGAFRLAEFCSFFNRDKILIDNVSILSELKEALEKFESFLKFEYQKLENIVESENGGNNKKH